MLLGGIAFGLVLGLIAGGSLDNLARIRLRWVVLLFAGLAIRAATELALEAGVDLAETLRAPLFALGYAVLLAGLWANRSLPGMSLAFVGIALNAIAVTANGGFMPVWLPSLLAAGFPATEPLSAFHLTVAEGVGTEALLAALPLADIIPIPLPIVRNVASVGDLFLTAGLGFFLFAATVRTPAELDEASATLIRRRLSSIHPVGATVHGQLTGMEAAVGAGLAGPGLVGAAELGRAASLGGGGVGTAGAGPAGIASGRRAVLPFPRLEPLVELVRRHPYVRLALDPSFSALWTGQLISMFGDRIHQVALAFLVLDATGSPIAVGGVFFAASLPNLIVGPIAGTLVDRWDHREVMIVSDLIRGALVLLLPVAAVIDLRLVYPLVFLITSVSLFFRPAKAAILPRMVAGDDLVTANSALWVGETIADVIGYVLAGLFVTFLGPQLPLAFWVDAVTYVASAILIAAVVVAPMARTAGAALERGIGFFAELREGWRFLRAETVLLANTLQAVVGQAMIGVILALTPVYVSRSIELGGVGEETAYSLVEGAIGAGNLVGGFVIGLIGARLALGRAVILGYVVTGAMVAAFAAAGSLPIAIGLAFGTGVGNLAFVIPSQTLFQRRVPSELMGRVLGLRFSLVFGTMTAAMALGGMLAETLDAGLVIGIFGVLTVLAGLGGGLVKAVRDA